MFPTPEESIPSVSAASIGMARQTTSGTVTVRAAYVSQVVSFRHCAPACPLDATALPLRISLQAFPVAPLLARLGDEFLSAILTVTFPFRALVPSCRTTGECHHA